MRHSTRTKRYHTEFEQTKIPELVTRLHDAKISLNDLQNGISFFNTIGKILTDLELKLPPLSPDYNANEVLVQDQGQSQSQGQCHNQGQVEGQIECEHFTQELRRLRKACILLLNGKLDVVTTDKKSKKRKHSPFPSECSKNTKESDRELSPATKIPKIDTEQVNGGELWPITNQNRRKMVDLLNICYVCKEALPRKHTQKTNFAKTKEYVTHPHYPWMCMECGEFNFKKRSSTADLTGKIAVVTGGRMKIGYEIVLKLLRANCQTVIVTTRFPFDAYRRFEAEPDFPSWSSRLRLYKLDLRFMGAVNSFCDKILRDFGRLDILIQNAAQTIRRPAAYYEELVKAELNYFSEYSAMPLNNNNVDLSLERPLVEGIQNKQQLIQGSLTLQELTDPECSEKNQGPESSMTLARAMTSNSSVPLHTSQLLLHSEDFEFPASSDLSKTLFPIGRKDEDGNQLDLRRRNTWILNLEEVDPVEMVEVSVVNYMAPFVILQRLTPLMQRQKTESNKDLGYIVLVSAMEGKFESCFKTGKHPHTNAAKAALNMLVRTSAKHYYKKLGILLNAVDTGWVTDEHPVDHFCRLPVPPPLDCIDGAARVLDPVFGPINEPHTFPTYGKFLKDYSPRSW